MNGLRSGLVIAGLAAAGLLLAMPGAQAASAGVDVAAAQAAASAPQVRAELNRFFAQADRAGSVTVESRSIPVYELSADFVAGVDGASAGEFAYFAIPAHSSDGQAATLWSVPAKDRGWQVGNIASGSREAELFAQLPSGAALLHEPQLDAWYAVRGGYVALMDAGASGRVAGEVVSVAAYQRDVAGRYADKLPGTAYAREGLAGGQVASVMPRGGDGQAQAPMRREFDWIPLLIIGGLLATGVGAYLLYSVRRPA